MKHIVFFNNLPQQWSFQSDLNNLPIWHWWKTKLINQDNQIVNTLVQPNWLSQNSKTIPKRKQFLVLKSLPLSTNFIFWLGYKTLITPSEFLLITASSYLSSPLIRNIRLYQLSLFISPSRISISLQLSVTLSFWSW